MQHYIEFDTTQQALLTDLRTQILTCTDWTRLTSDTVLLSTTAATAAAATVLTFSSTAGSGLAIGSVIAIDTGANKEWRTITAITGTTITVAAMTFAHAIGTQIRTGNELYKATTTRGAQMVVDLADIHPGVNNLNLAVWRTHDGTTGVDKQNRYLYWRNTGGAATNALHVILSISKEHIFFTIEGPRAGEAGAVSATLGSLRQYFFLCDLVPYDVGDTNPVVIAGGSLINSSDASLTNLTHIAGMSRNLDNNQSWVNCRLLTLTWPHSGLALTVNAQRQRATDNKYVLGPYVVFDDVLGMRGRLNNLFFAGTNDADTYDVSPPPVSTKIQYQSGWYKLLAVNKTEGARDVGGVLGVASGSSAATAQRSVVVAVPCLP